MERRHFLMWTGGVAASGLLEGGLASRAWGRMKVAPRQRGLVALAQDKKALKAGRKVDPVRLKAMVETAVCGATTQNDPKKAWQTLFSEKDVVGVKLSCIAGPLMSPSPAFVQLLIEGLKSAGLKDKQIILWERTERELIRAGFPINRGDKPGPLVMANDSPGVGFLKKSEISGKYKGKFSQILTRTTAHISLGVLKSHGLAGVSMGMKNYYGAIDNPWEYHHDGCAPFVADICASPHLGDKLRLTIIDACWAQCDGGPRHRAKWVWPFAGVLASTDPVAIDTAGASLIDKRRKEVGKPPLRSKGKVPRSVSTGTQRGLGIHDLSKIRLVKKIKKS